VQVPIQGSKAAITATVMAAALMAMIDISIVNVALSDIRASFGTPIDQIGWVSTGYMMANIVVIPMTGWLQRRFGFRRYFSTSVLIFTIASALCGLAWNLPSLVLFRVLQGIGGGAIIPTSQAILFARYPRAQHGMAAALFGLGAITGPLLGPTIGGYMIDWASWHWIFLVNVPIGALAFALARGSLREVRLAAPRVDVAGAVLITAAAMAAIYGLVAAAHHPWSSAAVRVPIALALALTAVFVFVELSVEQPLLPMRILRIRSLVVTSVIRGFMAMGMYAVFFFGSLDMADTLGFGPLRTGLAFLPQTLAVAVLSLGLTARVVRRFGPQRVLVAGLALIALAVGAMANLGLAEPYLPIRAAAHVVLGLGLGLSFLPLLMLAMSEVPPRDAGLGSAIVSLSIQLFGAVDLAILVTAASFRTHALEAAGAPAATATILGYRFAYAVAIGGILAGLTLATTLLRGRSRP